MLSCLEIRAPKWNRGEIRDIGILTREQKHNTRLAAKIFEDNVARAGVTAAKGTTITPQKQPEANKGNGAPRISNDRSDHQESRLEFSVYTNCRYSRGRGCHVGSGAMNQGRSLRYSVGPANRGYFRVGRSGMNWQSYYENYDEEYLYEHCTVPKEERNNHYSNFSQIRRWSLYGS